MRKKKASAAKTVKKPTRKPSKKTSPKKAVARQSYQKQIDNLYQDLMAHCKKALSQNHKEGQGLKKEGVKLTKALAAQQKKLATLEKRNNKKSTAVLRTQIKKAQKVCITNEKIHANLQQKIAENNQRAEQLQQDFASLVAESQWLISARKEGEEDSKTKAQAKSSKTSSRGRKPKQQQPAFEANNSAEENENQLALVIEEDFLDDEDILKN